MRLLGVGSGDEGVLKGPVVHVDPLRAWCMQLAFEQRRSTPADVAGSPRYSRAIRARWGRPPQAQHTCRLPRIVHH